MTTIATRGPADLCERRTNSRLHDWSVRCRFWRVGDLKRPDNRPGVRHVPSGVTGASQFAAVGVIGAGGSPISAAGSALLLAARNGLYGMTVSEFITGSRVKRTVAAHLTIDESTALAIGQKDPGNREAAFWAGGLSVFLFWNLGTLVGALGGTALGDPAKLGLDAAFPGGIRGADHAIAEAPPGFAGRCIGSSHRSYRYPFCRTWPADSAGFVRCSARFGDGWASSGARGCRE